MNLGEDTDQPQTVSFPKILLFPLEKNEHHLPGTFVHLPMFSLLLSVRRWGQAGGLAVPPEVCLKISSSHSEDGAIYPGAVSQLHRCPDYSSPHVAPCEVLPVLRGHASLLGLRCSGAACCLPWGPTAATVMGGHSWHPVAPLTCTHSAWHAPALGLFVFVL